MASHGTNLLVCLVGTVACGGQLGHEGTDRTAGGSQTSGMPDATAAPSGAMASDGAPPEDGDTTGEAGTLDATLDGGPCATWTCLVTTYFAAGTVGNCGNVVCHQSQFATPSDAYDYLAQLGYMGSPPLLVYGTRSPLAWFGGNMPPDGPTSSPQAAADLQAWADAGAPNN